MNTSPRVTTIDINNEHYQVHVTHFMIYVEVTGKIHNFIPTYLQDTGWRSIQSYYRTTTYNVIFIGVTKLSS